MFTPSGCQDIGIIKFKFVAKKLGYFYLFMKNLNMFEINWYELYCRCESADELGTHLNTQICKGCGSPSLLPTTPLQIGSDWVCQNSECLYRLEKVEIEYISKYF